MSRRVLRPASAPLFAQPVRPMPARAAVIVCTRNRPDALRKTLYSIARHAGMDALAILVMDGSDAAAQQQNAAALARLPQARHLPFNGPPSAARQRNAGLRRLPEDAAVVFFCDDDITLHPHAFRHLADALRDDPARGGVGAFEHAPDDRPNAPGRPGPWRSLFLLDHPRPGRVLASGHVSLYNTPAVRAAERPVAVQWLSTCCCAYRREAIDGMAFNEALEGALLEDRDFSYRVGERWTLAAVPSAQFVHHQSPINRRSVAQYAYARTIQRRWFVAQHSPPVVGPVAFWWSVVGELLARLTSRRPHRSASLRGLLRGVRDVLTRSHPLLLSALPRSA